jgi:hypothetical protein
MDSAIVTAFAAMCGSSLGALATFAGGVVTQRNHDRRGLLAAEIARREALYSDFIGESARLLVDALEHNVVDLKNLVPAYALISRIRLSSSAEVLDAAEHIVKSILETYRKPNLTAEQITSETIRGVDPIKNFSAICRAELDRVQQQF